MRATRLGYYYYWGRVLANPLFFFGIFLVILRYLLGFFFLGMRPGYNPVFSFISGGASWLQPWFFFFSPRYPALPFCCCSAGGSRLCPCLFSFIM